MVYILLAQGFEEAEALVPADLLRRAGIKVVLASHKAEDVTGGRGITIKVDEPLAHLDLTDRKSVV